MTPDAQAERDAIVEYMNYTSREAVRLSEVAQSEAAAAMFRAISNAMIGLAKMLEQGHHLQPPPQ